MPLLQRAAALQQMEVNQYKKLISFCITSHIKIKTAYLATVATTIRAANSL